MQKDEKLLPAPPPGLKRIVVAGAGFGGLKLARMLARKPGFEIVLIDRNNYHQFQPLFYQIATSGLEPSAIAFPLRKAFQNCPNVHIRITGIEAVDPQRKVIQTQKGLVDYDYLIIATGADTHFFGNERIAQLSYPMKSVLEAIQIRHRVLENFEEALSLSDGDSIRERTSIVIVGGGPTGVELAGAFAEMQQYILPKDYPGIDFSAMDIFLLEASPRILGGMSEKSSAKSHQYLIRLGVKILTGARVMDYNGQSIQMEDGSQIRSRTLIWAAGIISDPFPGIPPETWVANKRIRVDPFNQVIGMTDIFAIGDIACMEEPGYPKGHPQIAQAAIQQGKNLAENMMRQKKNQAMKPFRFRDLGVMATVGRNLSVVDLPWLRFSGFFAWLFWMFIHLMAIVGVKNRLLIFINWSWNYLTYDQSLRLIFNSNKLKNKH
jgi:NADH dehydrogenase